MNKLIAIVSFALSVYGCDVGGNTTIHRSSADGNDVLYSKVVAKPGFARFDCLRSASGRCFYTLYPRDCAAPPATAPPPGKQAAGDCQPRPAEHFSLSSGESRRLPTPSHFRMCVSTQADAVIPGCEAPEAIAAL